MGVPSAAAQPHRRVVDGLGPSGHARGCRVHRHRRHDRAGGRKTNRDVKELLVATPGVAADDQGGWIASGAVRGGITSGLSQLRADIYQVENSASAAGRLLVEVDGDAEAIEARRDEIIESINKTAKPYFGDLEQMTYAEVARRFTELSHPWTDGGLVTRFFEMLQRFPSLPGRSRRGGDDLPERGRRRRTLRRD